MLEISKSIVIGWRVRNWILNSIAGLVNELRWSLSTLSKRFQYVLHFIVVTLFISNESSGPFCYNKTLQTLLYKRWDLQLNCVLKIYLMYYVVHSSISNFISHCFLFRSSPWVI